MASLTFLKKNDSITVKGERYKIAGRTSEGAFELVCQKDATASTGPNIVSDTDLLGLYLAGEVVVDRLELNRCDPTLRHDDRSQNTQSEAIREEVRRRLRYVEACDRIFAIVKMRPCRQPEVQRHRRLKYRKSSAPDCGYDRIARIVEWTRTADTARMQGRGRLSQTGRDRACSAMVSPRTLQAWHKRWEQSGRSLAALVPQHHRKGRPGNRLSTAVVAIIKREIKKRWLTRTRPPLTLVHEIVCHEVDMLKERGVECDRPSYQAMRRWIAANLDREEILTAREGAEAAYAKVGFVRAVTPVDAPLKIIEIDHTILDLFVVTGEVEGKKICRRPNLTLAIDVATRMIYGFHIGFRKPSWETVMHTLRMGALKKPVFLDRSENEVAWPIEGLPHMIRMDNGPEFHCCSMQEAADGLSIELSWCPPRMPHRKGTIERFLGEVARNFCAMFAGRTFANPREKGDYNAQGAAWISLEELRAAFAAWVVHIYHNRPHRMLGTTPLQQWFRLEPLLLRRQIRPEAMILLTSQLLRNSVTREGIIHKGLTYKSEYLHACYLDPKSRPAAWEIRLDPSDISVIHVRDPKNGTFFEVPCKTAGVVPGTSMQAYDQLRAERRSDPVLSRQNRAAARAALMPFPAPYQSLFFGREQAFLLPMEDDDHPADVQYAAEARHSLETPPTELDYDELQRRSREDKD